MSTAALIVAGGSSRRFGGEVPKQFLRVAGRPLLAWTIKRFEEAGSIDSVVVVVAEEYLLHTGEKVVGPYDFRKVSKITIGGESRQESVMNGLNALPGSTSIVAIHDGARPMVKPADIDRVVAEAKSSRAAILAAPVRDTVKRVTGGYVMATLDRSNLYAAQTPQVFQFDLILEAHRKAAGSERSATDDAALIEAAGFSIRIVEPTGPNPKVTGKTDLEMIRPILEDEARG